MNSFDTRKTLCWHHPPSDALKLDVDFALFNDLHQVGVGAFLQDDQMVKLEMVIRKQSRWGT